MNNKLLKLVNPILFLAFLFVALSKIISKIPGPLNGNEILWEVHIYSGFLFVLLAFIHIILNWKWIMSQIFGIKPKAAPKKKK